MHNDILMKFPAKSDPGGSNIFDHIRHKNSQSPEGVEGDVKHKIIAGFFSVQSKLVFGHIQRETRIRPQEIIKLVVVLGDEAEWYRK